jgi:O-antigen/teichoic acid export membrane protein
MSSLKKQAIRGTIWTFAGYGLSQGIRLVSNLILTRLLVPQIFGLMTLVNTFFIGLNLFSDVGIGPSIIQNKRGNEPDFLNTAWTIQVIRGFIIWFCTFLLAWPLSRFYHPDVLWLFPLVGFCAVLSGFNSTALFTLNRQLSLGKLTLLDLAIQVIGIIIMIVWAWLSPTIWAIIFFMFLTSLLKMISSHWLVPEQRNHFKWDKKAFQEIISLGKWIFVSTAVSFLASQADRLILGRLFSLQMLGVYTVAFTLADIPRQVIANICSKVIFPTISSYQALPRKSLRAKILPKYRLIIFGAAGIIVLMTSFGDCAIALYDYRYNDAAWMLPVLSLGIWPVVLFYIDSSILLASGNSFYAAWGNFSKFTYMVVGLPLAFFSMGGLEGRGVEAAIIAIAFNDVPEYIVMAYGMWREKMQFLLMHLQATLLMLGAIALICTSRYLLGFGLPIDAIW